jgi:hypothetical protein
VKDRLYWYFGNIHAGEIKKIIEYLNPSIHPKGKEESLCG